MTNLHLTIHLRHSTKTHHIFNNATVRSNQRISGTNYKFIPVDINSINYELIPIKKTTTKTL